MVSAPGGLQRAGAIVPLVNVMFAVELIPVYCQDRFSLTILLGGPGMQGTNEEVSPDTSRC